MKDTQKEEPVAAVVSYETGEVIKEVHRGDKIVTSAQQEYLSTHQRNFKKKEGFVKVYINTSIELYKKLTTKELAICIGLMPFISYTDGVLRYNNKITTAKEISELLNEDYSNFSKIIKSLYKKEVIKKIEVTSDINIYRTKKCIVVNPYIFFRGNDVDIRLKELFINSIWADM